MKKEFKTQQQLTRKQMKTILGGDGGDVIDRDKRRIAKNNKRC